MPRFFISSATYSAMARTCVSDEPLAITKQSVMSVTPSRSRITTSFALRSRQSAAAVCAAARLGRVADDDVMRGIGSRTRLCRSALIFCSGWREPRGAPSFHKHNAAAQAATLQVGEWDAPTGENLTVCPWALTRCHGESPDPVGTQEAGSRRQGWNEGPRLYAGGPSGSQRFVPPLPPVS